MRQLFLVLLFFAVLGGASYTGWEWIQKEAYVVFSRQYVQEVSELSQLWNSQAGYPQGRNWLNDFYYQRRWELLRKWAKILVEYNRKLHLQGEFVQSIESFIKNNGDFRDSEKMKFYVLELKDRMSRLPKSVIRKSSSLLNLIASRLAVLKVLVEENQRLVRRVVPRLPQLEVIFQAQFDQDSSTYCSTHKAMNDRLTILAQMKQRCLDPENAPLPMCQQGATYFQAELDQLQKLDQWNIDKLRQRWPQWREPACTQ